MRTGLTFFLLSYFIWPTLSVISLTQNVATAQHAAYSLNATAVNTKAIRLDWQINDGFFLFKDKFKFDALSDGVNIGDVTLPASEIYVDPHFGELEVYRQNFSLDVPIDMADGIKLPRTLTLAVAAQACESNEDCYPADRHTLTLALADVMASEPEEEFLDPDIAFVFSAKSDTPGTISVNWDIADHYYMYRERFQFEVTDATGNTIVLPSPLPYPQGKIKNDEFFGDVEVYYKNFAVDITLNGIASGDYTLKATYQGCAEAGLCYPPMQKTQTIQVAAAGEPSSLKQALQGLQKNDFSDFAAFDADDEPLDPEIAFQFSSNTLDNHEIEFTWNIADGYYLYRDKLKFEIAGTGRLGEPTLPKGKIETDEFFGDTEVYYQQLIARMPVYEANSEVTVNVTYQGCAKDRLCYPPQVQTVTLPLRGETASIQTDSTPVTPASSVPVSEQDSIAQTISQSSLWLIILTFFGFGLLLSFTPCVFPMIPILSSIIVGQGDSITTFRAFTLSLVYVLAMALTYTVAGVIAGILGENLQAAFQNPWILSGFATIFILLSLSMFGFYELQLPSSLQSKLNDMSNSQTGGTYIGVGIMGFLSALIVGPCVAPPLAGALIYISQTQDAVLGGVALFALSMGMGVPLLVVGTSAGKILPRAGGWMETAKKVFGVLLLAVGVWMLERILPEQIAMMLYALLLIIPAIYMGALDTLDASTSGWKRLWKGVGIVMLVYGILLMIGAASGGKDVFQPLKGVGIASSSSAASAEHVTFQQVKGIKGLEQALNTANGRPVMFDFYADWCVECKEMEKYVFADPRVERALSDVILLQSDVTANDSQDKELLQKFGLFGPPSILFFNSDGQEQRGFRIVGSMSADEFLAHLTRFKATL